MFEIFAYYLQRGHVSVGFMGGAQIDQFGNVNATVIGDYHHPKVRLPGSGGSMEIAAWADRCYFITPHQKRRFPERCDFRTSAGFLDGRSSRQALNLRGGGPATVVTDLGLLEPDETGELILSAVHPGVDPAKPLANTGWPLKTATDLRQTQPPSGEELSILRAFDPERVYLDSAAG
jgi:glutaconate CoA-transferase subunit B